MSLRDQLVAATQPQKKEVVIEGVTVWMWGLNIAQAAQLAEMDGADATYWLLSEMLRDEEGNRLFDNSEGYEGLRSMDAKVATELAEMAQQMLQQGDITKNSEATQ